MDSQRVNEAVTVEHIALTKETYLELLEALEELDRAFKHASAESVNARRWLHYQWLLAQSQGGKAE